MLSVLAFYAPSRWTALFGEKRGNSYHHGLDIARGAREDVPALRSGKVVRSAYSSVLGYHVVIRVGDKDYDGYCHLVQPAALGTNLTQGQKVGALAGPDDLHGSQWTGPHLHLTNGPGALDVLGTSATRNPAPIVNSVRTSIAGGGVIPIEEGYEMTSKLVLHKVGANQAYYLVDPFSITAISDQNDITAYRAAYGEIVREGASAMDPFTRMINRNKAALRDAVTASITDLPTKGGLGQALTSTVVLVNEHADENKDAIIDAISHIPGGGSGVSGSYSLSLDIDTVPGTATGTASPAN
jgi:hypothetical protein